MPFCPNCGHELGDDANFCGACGAKVESTPEPSFTGGGAKVGQDLADERQRLLDDLVRLENDLKQTSAGRSVQRDKDVADMGLMVLVGVRPVFESAPPAMSSSFVTDVAKPAVGRIIAYAGGGEELSSEGWNHGTVVRLRGILNGILDWCDEYELVREKHGADAVRSVDDQLDPDFDPDDISRRVEEAKDEMKGKLERSASSSGGGGTGCLLSVVLMLLLGLGVRLL